MTDSFDHGASSITGGRHLAQMRTANFQPAINFSRRFFPSLWGGLTIFQLMMLLLPMLIAVPVFAGDVALGSRLDEAAKLAVGWGLIALVWGGISLLLIRSKNPYNKPEGRWIYEQMIYLLLRHTWIFKGHIVKTQAADKFTFYMVTPADISLSEGEGLNEYC